MSKDMDLDEVKRLCVLAREAAEYALREMEHTAEAAYAAFWAEANKAGGGYEACRALDGTRTEALYLGWSAHDSAREAQEVAASAEDPNPPHRYWTKQQGRHAARAARASLEESAYALRILRSAK